MKMHIKINYLSYISSSSSASVVSLINKHRLHFEKTLLGGTTMDSPLFGETDVNFHAIHIEGV